MENYSQEALGIQGEDSFPSSVIFIPKENTYQKNLRLTVQITTAMQTVWHVQCLSILTDKLT